MMMAAVLVFFPVMVNVTSRPRPGRAGGARADALRTPRASGRCCRKVRIPNALPFFFTALKLGATLSLIGAIVGEYFGGVVARPRPDHRPERERTALRRHVGGDPPRAPHRDRVLPRRSRPSSGSSSRGTRRVSDAGVCVGPTTRYRSAGPERRVHPGWRRPRRGSRRASSCRVRSRPRSWPAVLADRAGRLHERRHAVTVRIGAGAASAPASAPARSAPRVGRRRRRSAAAPATGPAPAPVGAAGSVRRLLRGRASRATSRPRT